jgi:hypothetical protein
LAVSPTLRYRFDPLGLFPPSLTLKSRYGTAVEHHSLYQYQFANAQNILTGFVQTETPYEVLCTPIIPFPCADCFFLQVLPAEPGCQTQPLSQQCDSKRSRLQLLCLWELRRPRHAYRERHQHADLRRRLLQLLQ